MSQAELQQAIKEARPKLSVVAPLTSAICWGYVAVNIVLGLGMFFLYDTRVPLAVADIASYQIWGVLFGSLALLTAYFLLTNNWKATRNTQLAGILFKAIWGAALVIRCFEVPQTILITAIWVFLAYIQIVTYVHFLPIPKGEGNAESRT